MRHILQRAALPPGRLTIDADLVLVHLDHNAVTPYVTWQMNMDDKSTYWGHYHETLEDAEREFDERCADKRAVKYTDKRPEFS